VGKDGSIDYWEISIGMNILLIIRKEREIERFWKKRKDRLNVCPFLIGAKYLLIYCCNSINIYETPDCCEAHLRWFCSHNNKKTTLALFSYYQVLFRKILIIKMNNFQLYQINTFETLPKQGNPAFVS